MLIFINYVSEKALYEQGSDYESEDHINCEMLKDFQDSPLETEEMMAWFDEADKVCAGKCENYCESIVQKEKPDVFYYRSFFTSNSRGSCFVNERGTLAKGFVCKCYCHTATRKSEQKYDSLNINHLCVCPDCYPNDVRSKFFPDWCSSDIRESYQNAQEH